MVAVASVTTAVLVTSSKNPAKAIADTDTHTGRATFYSLGDSGLGNCSFPTVPADRLYAALGPEDYAHAGGCGGYIDVTGPKGTARVLAADKCPECEPGHLDLSMEAFAKIGGTLSDGIIPISYRGVKNPAGVGPISIRLQEGSSQWWTSFLAIDHGNPLTSMEYRDSAGAWQQLDRAEYNYWVKHSGAGPGPFTLRLTDVYGNVAIVNDIAMSPGAIQTTTVRMYGDGGTATTTPAAPTPTDPASTTVAPTTPSAPTSATSSTTSSGPSANATRCSASYKPTTSWPGGFQAEVTVKAGATAISQWKVTWTLASGQTISQTWNGNLSTNGSSVTVTNATWNGSLPANGSTTFGLQGSGVAATPTLTCTA